MLVCCNVNPEALHQCVLFFMFGEDDSCVDLLEKPGLPCFAMDNVCVSLHQGRVILIRGMHQVFFLSLSYFIWLWRRHST